MFTEVQNTRDRSWGERAFILGGLRSGIRTNGRSPFQYREIDFETGVIESSYGSSRVKVGNTEILASVKGELRRCDPRHVNHGAVQFSARISPVAGKKFAGSRGEVMCEEVVGVLTQAYGAPGALDYHSLCIKPETYYWLLSVDLVILAVGGNLIDVAGLAAKCALHNTSLPKIELEIETDGKPVFTVDADIRKSETLDVSSAPLLLTFVCVGDKHVVDPDEDEEACADVKIVTAVSSSSVTSVVKLGDACVVQKTIDAVVETAEAMCEELDGTIMECLRAVESSVTAAAVPRLQLQ